VVEKLNARLAALTALLACGVNTHVTRDDGPP
jgi:hypothetical protein